MLFDYSGGQPSQRRAVARTVDQVHPDANFIYCPYAEILMIKAEALGEQGNFSEARCVWGGGGVGTEPWCLALLACGGAYWPLALEPSAMTSRHPYFCGHPPALGGLVQGPGI